MDEFENDSSHPHYSFTSSLLSLISNYRYTCFLYSEGHTCVATNSVSIFSSLFTRLHNRWYVYTIIIIIIIALCIDDGSINISNCPFGGCRFRVVVVSKNTKETRDNHIVTFSRYNNNDVVDSSRVPKSILPVIETVSNRPTETAAKKGFLGPRTGPAGLPGTRRARPTDLISEKLSSFSSISPVNFVTVTGSQGRSIIITFVCFSILRLGVIFFFFCPPHVSRNRHRTAVVVVKLILTTDQ